MPNRVVRAAAVLSVAMVSALPAGATDGPRGSLEGHWKLNPDLTARLRESERARRMPEPGERPPGGRPGGRGPGGPPPRGDFPRGGPPGGSDGEGRRGGPGIGPEELRRAEELWIARTASSVVLTDSDGFARALPTDGSKVRVEEGLRGPARMRATWTKEGALEVRIKPKKGERRIETYVLSNDGTHLFVTITLPARRDFQLHLAYDRAVEGAGHPPVGPPYGPARPNRRNP